MDTSVHATAFADALKQGAPQMFPTLTPAQMERIATHGRIRSVSSGEVLFEVGTRNAPFFVVRRGRIQAVRTLDNAETLIAEHGPGQFTGEILLLTGRPTLASVRVAESGEVVEIDREGLRTLVQTDSELSEIVLRAFILRRAALISNLTSDVLVLGSTHCGSTLRVREFLTRNGQPYQYIDLDRESDIQELLDRFQVGPNDVPVVVCRGELVLRRPTNEQIADCLGFNEAIDPMTIWDTIIVGAGPAGLAAAVYAASEGLSVLVVETMAPGGQAGTSSRIENYLGFPNGISGKELAGRAYAQALKFGAQFSVARGARRLECTECRRYTIEIGSGDRIHGRTVLVASGASYRKLPQVNLTRFEGIGVYHSATFVEAQLCGDEEVIVVGGGNSAGQAAVYLSQIARRVHILVRSDGLAESMSRYLVRRIEESGRIVLHTCTEIVALEGEGHLERVRWHDKNADTVSAHDIRHIFAMTGAVPSTDWLDGCVVLDDQGFIKTGPDLSPVELSAAKWPLSRPPYLLETSRPGVFAIGDVRAGNVKRVASAVGEGAIAVALVHQALRE